MNLCGRYIEIYQKSIGRKMAGNGHGNENKAAPAASPHGALSRFSPLAGEKIKLFPPWEREQRESTNEFAY